jgi:hypothetical protein
MRRLSRIFEAGNVDIVFSGHVHNFQRSLPLRDESTRDLMVAYYDRLLAGVGRSAALRAVQIEMLKDGRDPSSWAAFIPSGDWTPLGR